MTEPGSSLTVRGTKPLASAPNAGEDVETAKTGRYVAGGVLGALAASSCCIVPLVLFSAGASGAWIGSLTALYPYKPYFLVAAAGFLWMGFYRIYRRPKAAACAAGGGCVRPLRRRLLKAALWGATALVLAALAFPYVAPLVLA